MAGKEAIYQRSSYGVNLNYQRDNLRIAEDNGNLEISGFLTDWIVMKIMA